LQGLWPNWTIGAAQFKSE